MSERPLLDPAMSDHDFTRWYWTMAELQPFARSIGVAASGRKADVTARIAAQLAGRPQPKVPARRSARGPQLSGDLTRATVIPAGQRSTTALREFFVAEIGPSFRFNGHMRSFLLAGEATLGDAIDHWHATVGTPLPDQSESLEFNRFTQAWHRANPNGSAAECRAAWAVHRSTPADER